jgi:phosphoglycolate phosphatase-like HAD superfamily hydrolase
MKRLARMNAVIMAALFFSAASVIFTTRVSADKATAKTVRKKMAETAEAIKNYSVDQRDEALKKVKAALDDINARIRMVFRTEFRTDEKWERMYQLARKKVRTDLKALKKQREDLAERHGKYSSGHAWEDVKKGFVNSYHALRKACTNVRPKLQ